MAQQNMRARQQQRQRLLMILLLLVLLGAAAFYFLVLNKQEAQKNAVAPRPLGQVAVPIISKEVPIGARISRRMFTVKFMKPLEVPTDAILSVDEFLGRFANKPLLEGNYIRYSDVSASGATGGYSGLANPGKRLVVLDAKNFPGAMATFRVGDHVDVLAFTNPNGALSASSANTGKSLSDSAVTLQGGGSQPGDPNSQARQNARARREGAAAATNSAATTATLVAENAEVMRVPVKGKDTEFLVLQMTPQDAHVTMLMAASNAVMRVVFRPFNDETRLTQDAPPKITTRLPKPVADPDAVMIIAGNVRAVQKPNSALFADEKEIQRMKSNELTPTNPMFGDTPSGNTNVLSAQNTTAAAPQQNNGGIINLEEF